MQAIHSLGILSAAGNADDGAGFLLTNKRGGYCSFLSGTLSRYSGFFYFDESLMEMYKLIESIESVNSESISALKNGFYYSERISSKGVESFVMPEGLNSLIYEMDSEKEVDIVLDCKKSYDNREWGRHYSISEENGAAIIKFSKKTDKREDSTGGANEFSVYLAIKSDIPEYKKNEKWVERRYDYDEKRNSSPFKRHVYNALRVKGKRIIFTASKSRDAAVKECEYAFGSCEALKKKEKDNFFRILEIEHVKKILKSSSLDNEAKSAYLNAVNSLGSLAVSGKKAGMIMAGLPWFFQPWARDSLVSLRALSKANNEAAEKIMRGYLDRIGDDGRLPNAGFKPDADAPGSADAHGWLFLRSNELIKKICKNKDAISSIRGSLISIKKSKNTSQHIKEYIKKCSSTIRKKEYECHKMLYELESSLDKSINALLKSHTQGSFEVNSAKETWMDTEFGDAGRKGARIEIQALRLSMYRLMFELSQNRKYRVLENILKAKVREKFWNGNILADGLDDFTIRPNIFIAAYAYPELLTAKEWEICFESALNGLWLEWGGISTIDKNSQLFKDSHSGEDAKSYHRGDSWFWINNLAALMLSRINKDKFKGYIKKIMEASTREILWKGCIGCHAELSSARELRSEGCWSQAWSSAMFIEMVDEVVG